MAELDKREKQGGYPCKQCGAPLAVPHTFRVLNVACAHCRTVNEYEPGTRTRYVEASCLHSLCQEASWNEFVAMHQAEDAYKRARPHTIQHIQAWEAAQIAYHRKYLTTRLQYLPDQRPPSRRISRAASSTSTSTQSPTTASGSKRVAPEPLCRESRKTRRSWESSHTTWESSHTTWESSHTTWESSHTTWESSHTTWESSHTTWESSHTTWESSHTTWESSHTTWESSHTTWESSHTTWESSHTTWESSH